MTKLTYQSVLVPGDISTLVGVGVAVAFGLTSLAAEEAVKVGADLVGAAALNSVALVAAGLEELGTLASVTWSEKLVSFLLFRLLHFFQFGFAHA